MPGDSRCAAQDSGRIWPWRVDSTARPLSKPCQVRLQNFQNCLLSDATDSRLPLESGEGYTGLTARALLFLPRISREREMSFKTSRVLGLFTFTFVFATASAVRAVVVTPALTVQ